MLTRDINIDWNNVSDIGQKLPAGIIQFRVLDYEEKMSSGEGQDKHGNQKVAKYMIQAKLEAVAPEGAVGCTRDEYFVLGSADDPLMQKAETFYEAIGARSLKRMLSDAQVPWSASLVATLNSSKGAMFLMQVKHGMQKSNRGEIDENTGKLREFVGVDTGRTYKLGEMQPKLIPCGLPACEQCKEVGRMQGGSEATMMTQAPAPAMPAAPMLNVAPALAPAISAMAPPAMPAAPPTVAPSILKPAMPVPPAPAAPPVMPQPVMAPAPVAAPPVMPPVAPVVNPAPVPPVAAPAQGMLCKICELADIPIADFPAHVQACAMKAGQAATGGFKQEA